MKDLDCIAKEKEIIVLWQQNEEIVPSGLDMDGKEETSLRKVFKILYVGPKRNCQVGKNPWRENGFYNSYLKC